MRSGLLNERLKVFRMETTTDQFGAVVPTLVEKGEYWCRVLHAKSDRSDNDIERVVYNPTIRFELRESVPVKVDDIIQYDGEKYVITMIEKNHNLDIQTLYVDRYEQ